MGKPNKPVTIKDLMKFRDEHQLSPTDMQVNFGFSHPSKWSTLTNPSNIEDLDKPVSLEREIKYRHLLKHPEMIQRAETSLKAVYDQFAEFVGDNAQEAFSVALGKSPDYYSRATQRNESLTAQTTSVLDLLKKIMDNGDESLLAEFIEDAKQAAAARGQELVVDSGRLTVRKKKPHR